MAIDERGDDHADRQAAADVDRERAPGEDAKAAAFDQSVKAVAAEGSKGASDSNGERR